MTESQVPQTRSTRLAPIGERLDTCHVPAHDPANSQDNQPVPPAVADRPTVDAQPDEPTASRLTGPVRIGAQRGPTWLADEATIAVRLIVLGAAGLGLLWLMQQVQLVVVAAFLGFAVTAVLWPLTRMLRRFLPAVVAALLSVTTFLALFLVMFWFVSSRVVSSFPVLQGSVIGAFQSLDEWGRGLGVSLPGDLVDNTLNQLQSRVGALVSGVGEAALNGLSALSLMVTVLVVSIFLTIFGLTSGDGLANGFLRAIPTARRDAVAAALQSAFTAARWWLLASTVTGLVDGLFIGFGMHLLGLPLAAAIGVLTFIFGFIPNIGATIAGAVAVLIGVFFDGPLMGLWVLLLVLAVQQIEGNVLSPLLLSRAMQFHPIVTMLLITAGGFTFGIVGLFLAVPLVGVTAAGVRGWRGVVQAQDAPPEPEAAPAA